MANREWLAALSLLIIALKASCDYADSETPMTDDSITIALPEPQYDGDVSIEETLLRRRSIRDYTNETLTLPELSQLLWAAQGITDPRGFRTAPSAGATYPLEVYAVAGDVEGITDGIYRYRPHQHELVKVLDGDKREVLAQAALNQQFIAQAPLDIVITAIYERTTGRYGDRGIRYVHMEAGHAAQNIYLQAVALNLGTVVIGAFYDNPVKEILELADDETPLYIIPVGRMVD